MGLGTILSLLPWLIAGLVLLALLGFGRPVVEAITRTWTEFMLPILRKVAESPTGRAVVLGLAAFIGLLVAWYIFDGWGYARAKGECNTEIAMRERDAAVAELKTVRDRLARLTEIMQNDATRALARVEDAKQNEDRINAIPRSTRLCFDEPTARSLWGPRTP